MYMYVLVRILVTYLTQFDKGNVFLESKKKKNKKKTFDLTVHGTK